MVLIMKKTDLQWRLEASVLYETLRRQPHPHAARRADLQERLPAVDVLGAIVWMRGRGTSIRVVWRPLDESVVLARSNKCEACAAEDPLDGALVPFSPITGSLPDLTLLPPPDCVREAARSPQWCVVHDARWQATEPRCSVMMA